MELTQKELTSCEWQLKFRLPSGILLGKDRSGKALRIFPNEYLSRRLQYATKMVHGFKGDFDIASIYAKINGVDMGEVARYNKDKKCVELIDSFN